MITEVIPSLEKDRSVSRVIADIKSLFKGLVLIANVLPVFIGYWLALHFTNASFIEHLDVFFLTMIGSTVLMAGALVLNNWYDVDIDTVMVRTQQRPTVTGRISLKTVLILGITLSIIGFVLLLFTTVEAAIYGFIGWFTYVILYTMWSKRRYTLNTVIGSVSGAVTPLIGWAAIAPAMHIVPIVLFIILFIWQIPHTFAIAMKKSEEYRVADVAMLPVVYGFDMTKRQMAVYIICLLPWPFYLSSLGMTFVIVATILNLGWFVVSVSSSYVKDDFKWAQINFLYSVNYLAILFIMMFIATLPFFN